MGPQEYRDVLEESAATLRSMSLQDFMQIEQHINAKVETDVLMRASVATDMTEIADIRNSLAIKREGADWDATVTSANPVRNNFMQSTVK